MRRTGWIAPALLMALALRIALGAEAPPVFEMERYYTAPASQTADPPPSVGDVIRFRWIGDRKPPGTAVRVAPLTGARPLSEEGWEIYAQPKDDAVSAFSMIPLKSGELKLPELQIEDADGKVLGRTRSATFRIAGVEPPADGAPPIEFVPPMGIPFPRPWLWGVVLGGTLLVAALGWWLWQYSRKRSSRAAAAPEARRVLPADEEALGRLDKLEREGWAARGEIKRHYFGVSETLKHYIERRYGFDAAEQTTREMMAGLSGTGAGEESVRTLGTLFERLDLVKFTDHRPPSGSDEPAEVLKLARAWIRRTRPAGTGGATHAP